MQDRYSERVESSETGKPATVDPTPRHDDLLSIPLASPPYRASPLASGRHRSSGISGSGARRTLCPDSVSGNLAETQRATGVGDMDETHRTGEREGRLDGSRGRAHAVCRRAIQGGESERHGEEVPSAGAVEIEGCKVELRRCC